MQGDHLSIGDFARATHLSVKMLRRYHDSALLVPAFVDPDTGYRSYRVDQIPTAQVIRRMRALDMPLAEIASVLEAQTVDERNRRIRHHLGRLEGELGRTQQAVAALRSLVDSAADTNREHVEIRTLPAMSALLITEQIEAPDGGVWLQGALGELRGVCRALGSSPTGHAGGIYAEEIFTRHRGSVTVYVPCAVPRAGIGRVETGEVPAAEMAVAVHRGDPAEIDRTYGQLAAWVAAHAVSVDGPIREHYLVGSDDTADSTRWVTEVCWPVFGTQVGGTM